MFQLSLENALLPRWSNISVKTWLKALVSLIILPFPYIIPFPLLRTLFFKKNYIKKTIL